MKKLTALILILATILSVSASSVTAYEPDDPCLLYGYDPDELDNYETYGDTYFLDMLPVKAPSGIMIINLYPHATQNIINASSDYSDVENILSKDYFPELDISEIYPEYHHSSSFENTKEYYSKYELGLSILVKLKDTSKKSMINSLIALAPRCDIDIKSVFHYSFDLNDVSNALKYIAGWTDKNYFSATYDITRRGDIELEEVAYMLRVIARWELDDFPYVLSWDYKNPGIPNP